MERLISEKGCFVKQAVRFENNAVFTRREWGHTRSVW
jgi:hypothetical protein